MGSGNELPACPHCGYQPESLDDRDRHMRGHKVVKYRDDDGILQRRVE